MELMNELVNKDNKKFLKSADVVVFRLLEHGQSVIECQKKVKVDGYEVDGIESMNVGTRLECYQKNSEISSAVTSFSFAHDDLKWSTIVKNLKKDDEIVLEWMCGNDNNVMKDVGITCDTLHLIIKRNGLNAMKFHVEDRVTNTDSIARMIKTRPNFN